MFTAVYFIKTIYIYQGRHISLDIHDLGIQILIGYKNVFNTRIVEDKPVVMFAAGRVYRHIHSTYLQHTNIGHIPLRTIA